MAAIAHYMTGSGPDIVLLHPIGLDGSSWSKVARALEGFTCHLVDLPGHGNSSPLPGRPGLDDYADAVEASLKRLGLRGFTLAGLSFGGMIAQVLASRRMEGLAGVVLCGCASTFPEAVRPEIRARGDRALAGGMAAVIEETMARWFTPAFRQNGDTAAISGRLLATDPDQWAAAWAAISALDMTERLAGIDVPTLCIAGGEDLATPPEVVRLLAGRVPGAAFLTLPDAPHMMHWETPSALAETLTRFIGDSVSPRDR